MGSIPTCASMDELPEIVQLLADHFILCLDRYWRAETCTDTKTRWPKRFIPGYPGVYIICSDDAVEYVGQSSSIATRLANGHKVFRQAQFTVFTMTVIEDESLRYGIESLLIASLRPRQNRMIGRLSMAT